MAEAQRVNAEFNSNAFDSIADNLFKVVGFSGVEAISQPFEFNISLLSAEPDLDLQELVGQNATLTLTRDTNTREIHGVIFSIEQGEEAQFDQYYYHALLVPRIYMMHLSRQNQIYQELTVPDIIKNEILDTDYSTNMLADDLEFRLANSYPIKEYLVQYKESDLNFISRLMEHEGIYYYFDHLEGRDKMIFCDKKNQLDPVLTENKIPYVPASGMASFADEAIHKFSLKQTQTACEVVLKDFNYRQPHLPLQGNASINENGLGRLYEYGDHFKNPQEGDTLAQVRAEAHLCGQRTCIGQSDAIMFSAGKLFEMLDHFRNDFNQEYLITRIHHRGGQALPGVSASNNQSDAIAYSNDFEAIPATLEFRPQQIAQKPKLYGILNAIVDGEQDSNRAQIDDQGRYKLVMPFDISGKGKGKASRWVRKAETYGGQGTGMHFPLLKGTEVIWTCIDGDPDRPIITGVVPNPLNKSVVTAKNSARNIIKTAAGITCIMDDGQSSPGTSGNSGTEQQHTKVAAFQTASPLNTAPSNELIQQQHHSAIGVEDRDDAAGGGGVGPGEKMYSMSVTDYNSDHHNSYFRMGAPDTDQTMETDYSYADASGGIFMSTDGKITQSTSDDFFSKTSGISFKQDLSSSGSYSRGYSAGIKLAGSTNINATYDLTYGLGLSTKLTLGTDVSINYGLKFSSGSTKEYKNVSGALVQQAKNVLIRASDFDGKVKAIDKAIGGATILAGIGAAGTTITGVPNEIKTWNNSDINKSLLTASAISSAATVAGSIAYAIRKIKHEEDELKKSAGTESFIAMDNDSIVLSCDGSSIVINGEGVFINGKTLATGQLPKNKNSFSPNQGDLKDAKVSKVYPEYVNLNAQKRMDIRSQQSIYIAANPKIKMDDKIPPTVDKSKMKATPLAPPPPNAGAILQFDKSSNASLYSKGDLTFVNESKIELEARGKMQVTADEAKFSKNLTVTGVMKDKNTTST